MTVIESSWRASSQSLLAMASDRGKKGTFYIIAFCHFYLSYSCFYCDCGTASGGAEGTSNLRVNVEVSLDKPVTTTFCNFGVCVQRRSDHFWPHTDISGGWDQSGELVRKDITVQHNFKGFKGAEWYIGGETVLISSF